MKYRLATILLLALHVARANTKKYPGRTIINVPKGLEEDGDGTTNKATKKEEAVFGSFD